MPQSNRAGNEAGNRGERVRPGYPSVLCGRVRGSILTNSSLLEILPAYQQNVSSHICKCAPLHARCPTCKHGRHLRAKQIYKSARAASSLRSSFRTSCLTKIASGFQSRQNLQNPSASKKCPLFWFSGHRLILVTSQGWIQLRRQDLAGSTLQSSGQTW